METIFPRGTKRATLRQVSTIATAMLIVAVLGMGAMWGWTSHTLRDATAVAVRDTQSMRITRELERTIYLAHRLDNVYAVAPEVGTAREESWFRVDRLLVEAEALVGDEAERTLLHAIATSLADYKEQRAELERRGSDIASVIREIQPILNIATRNIEDLRALNIAQIHDDAARTQRIERLSDIVAATAATLMVVILLVALLVIRQRVLLPVFDLHRAVVRFRQEGTPADAQPSGLREIAELTIAFHDLTEALGRQREQQIEFLAGIAHDLRNPLSGLKLAAQALAMAPANEMQQQTVQIILRQVDQLTRMVADLADVTLIEAGALAIEKSEVPLARAISEVVSLYAPTTTLHEIVVEAPEDPLTVTGDQLRLEQVIGNLVNNAIKYSPGGGRIVISSCERDGRAVLSVLDHGVGISPEGLTEVFLPFRRLHPEVAAGTGLGLSVVRRIVEAHDGTIEIRSEPGNGTTVEVSLPLVPPHAEARQESVAV